jgi:hypothetical protein
LYFGINIFIFVNVFLLQFIVHFIHHTFTTTTPLQLAQQRPACDLATLKNGKNWQ